MPQVYKHYPILNLWHIFCKLKFYVYELFSPSCKYNSFHNRNVQIIKLKANAISPPEIHSINIFIFSGMCVCVYAFKILSN